MSGISTGGTEDDAAALDMLHISGRFRSLRKLGPDKPAKARQKDVVTRWTVKFAKAKPTIDGTPQLDIAIPTDLPREISSSLS